MLASLKNEYLKGIELDKARKNPYEKKNKNGLESLRGIFSEYARRDLNVDEIIKLEQEAWQTAAAEKYLKSYDISGC